MRWRGRGLCGIAIAACLGCQTLVEEMPASPEGTTGPSPSVPMVEIPIVVVPVPLPTPETGSPQPPASPQPTAEPTAEPTPPPAGGSCSPGPGTGAGNQCGQTSPAFLADVDAAIDATVSQHPELFDLGDVRGDRGYLVLDPRRYHDAVVASLRARGLCAEVMDYEEIAVKGDNSFGEGYDIYLSSGHIRRGAGSYRGTCWPAWF